MLPTIKVGRGVLTAPRPASHMRRAEDSAPCRKLSGLAVGLTVLLLSNVSSAAEANVALHWNQLPSLPDPIGVAAPFAGVSGGALLVAGGANFPDKAPWEGGRKVWHDMVLVLEQPNGPWKVAGRLPRPLAYGVTVTYGDEIICAGGSDEKQHFAQVFALRWQDGKLAQRTLPSLPRPVANACGAMLDTRFYLAGGISAADATSALAGFYRLDLKTPQPVWTELPSWPGTARMLALAAARDGAFFVVGGVSLTRGPTGQPVRQYLRDAYRYDPARGWKRIADLPHPIAASASPAPNLSDTTFLVISGDDGVNAALTSPAAHPGFTNEVLAYDAARDKWIRIGTTPAPRVTVPAVHWRERWVIPSGEQRPGVRSPEVWSLHAP